MATKTRPRERAPHLGPERRRPQVLDAARTLAVRDGIGAVTFGSLAAEMGVTRPVLYACFRDRVELLSALFDREQESLTASLMAALHESGGATTPEGAFVRGFTALFAAAAEQPEPWHLILHGEPDIALSHRVAEARSLITQEATSWIRPAMVRWWATESLDRKLPVLIEWFMATCESGIRSLLDDSNDWGAEDLGAFIGRAVCRAFESA